MELTREMYREWRRDPVTRAVLEAAAKVKAAYEEDLIKGRTLNTESAEETHGQTALVVGRVEGMDHILDDEYLEMVMFGPDRSAEEAEDEENIA